jgi:hypothetical protein
MCEHDRSARWTGVVRDLVVSSLRRVRDPLTDTPGGKRSDPRGDEAEPGERERCRTPRRCSRPTRASAVDQARERVVERCRVEQPARVVKFRSRRPTPGEDAECRPAAHRYALRTDGNGSRLIPHDRRLHHDRGGATDHKYGDLHRRQTGDQQEGAPRDGSRC